MGIWGRDERKDFFEIEDEQIKKNANCVVAIMSKDNLIDEKNGFSTLKLREYGEAYDLCENERFRDQPVIEGWSCSGFLVSEDIIATASYCLRGHHITDLRIVFGYNISDPTAPVIRVSQKNIFKGIKIIHKVYNQTGNRSDWALMQLDRKVVGQTIAKLSETDISCEQPVYTIGYPVGLPLKYAPGAHVGDIKESLFAANLDVFMGNGGSPVFDSNRHEVIGIVVHGDTRDFRWAGKCKTSIIYSNREIHPEGPKCTMTSKFIDFIYLSIETSEDYSENKQIFISYSQIDIEFVNQLTTDLKNSGMSVWHDEKEIGVGDSIVQKVEEGISGSNFFCLVISEHSVNSKWVKREYGTALSKQLSHGKPKVLPLLIQNVKLPSLLEDIKYADFSREYDSGLKQLLNAIKI